MAGAGFPLLLLPDEDIAEEVRQYVLTDGGNESGGDGDGPEERRRWSEGGGGPDERSDGWSEGRAWSILFATSSNAC